MKNFVRSVAMCVIHLERNCTKGAIFRSRLQTFKHMVTNNVAAGIAITNYGGFHHSCHARFSVKQHVLQEQKHIDNSKEILASCTWCLLVQGCFGGFVFFGYVSFELKHFNHFNYEWFVRTWTVTDFHPVRNIFICTAKC